MTLRRALPVFFTLTAIFVAAAPTEAQRRNVDPRRQTARALMKPISVDFQEARLEDVIRFIEDFSGANLRPMWLDERHSEGLDKDQEISVSVENITVLSLIERVLNRAQQGFEESAWQFGEHGELQIGPKSRLNRFASVKLYDINDLLFQIQDFDEPPDLGLGEIIEGTQGGTTEQFERQEDQERLTRTERAARIVDLIINFIEPEQWVDNGGDAASVRFHDGALVIRAPDYIHRQIVGYSFWPRSAPRGPSRPAGGVNAGDGDPSAGATRYTPDGGSPIEPGDDAKKAQERNDDSP